MMKNYNLTTVWVLLICAVFNSYGQDLSFSVDLSDSVYPEAGKQVSIGSNSLGAWDTDLVVLSDPDGDGIYTGTYTSFPVGDFLFRIYQNVINPAGNWGGDWITSASLTDDCVEQTDNGGLNYKYTITSTTSATLSFKLNECYTETSGILLSSKLYNLIDFSVYPNPVEDYLSIETEEEVSAVSVYNVFGSQVLVSTSYEGGIDVSSLATGVYVVVVEAKDVRSTVKFVKK